MRILVQFETKTFFSYLSSVLFLVIFCSFANAASDCSSYGDTAAAQHAQNKANNCGFSGLRWHSDRNAHETFCNLVGTGNAAKETRKRQRDLDKCLSSGGQQEEVEAAPQCKKSDIAVGKGATNQLARGSAQDQLGAQRAQMIHDGYSKCLYNDLGCTGPNGDKTCRLSVRCCTQ